MTPALQAQLDHIYRTKLRQLEVDIHYMQLQWKREEADRWWAAYYKRLGLRRPLLRRTDNEAPRDYPV